MVEIKQLKSFFVRMGCAKFTKPTIRSWLWAVTVLVCFVVQVIMNSFLGRAFNNFGGESIGSVSRKQPTFITPDGRTFSVWAVIYLLQGCFSIYQVIPCFQNSHAGVSRARLWVIVLFVGNCLWLPVFCNKLYWLAFMLMLIMDIALVMIYRMMMINYGAVDRTQSAGMLLPSVVLEERDDTIARFGESDKLPAALLHPWPVKLLCFTGFSANISWLAVASMANLLIATGSSGWHQSYNVTATDLTTTTIHVNGSVDFSIMAVCLVAAIACVLAVRNCDVPYALVAIWALGGVQRAQTPNQRRGYPKEATNAIADWAWAMMVVVAIAALAGLVKAVFESVSACKASKTQRGQCKVSETQREQCEADVTVLTPRSTSKSFTV